MDFFRRVAEHEYRAIFPTKAVLEQQLAANILQEAARLFAFADALLFKMELCLQEGLQNAAVHGNLGVSMAVTTVTEFEAMQALIQQRLVESPYQERHIVTTLRVADEEVSWAITDEGKGFSVDDLQKQTLFGRGLTLIAALADQYAYDQATTTLHFSFKLL